MRSEAISNGGPVKVGPLRISESYVLQGIGDSRFLQWDYGFLIFNGPELPYFIEFLAASR
jgi:hypothetical protein